MPVSSPRLGGVEGGGEDRRHEEVEYSRIGEGEGVEGEILIDREVNALRGKIRPNILNKITTNSNCIYCKFICNSSFFIDTR